MVPATLNETQGDEKKNWLGFLIASGGKIGFCIHRDIEQEASSRQPMQT
ncbi:hypothetical protein [Pseudarthrobacter sulfonivorans]|nr:hypothetical protein [Pseudarthrobacter sulfonivorans]